MRTYPTTLVLVAVLVAPPSVAATLDLYGRINVSVQHSEEGPRDGFELENNASRIGVKGEADLRPGLTAVYQLEFGVNIDDDEDDRTFTPRNQYVGLRGGFGTVKVGRHDTALKDAQGEFDLFDDLEGDIARTLNGENRLPDYIAYTTPELGGGFHATVNFFPGDDADAGSDGARDRTSFSVDYENERLYAALAHDRDVDGDGVDTTRAVGGYTLGDARVMLLWQRTDAGDDAEDGFGASVAWSFGRNTAKLQYLSADIWRVAPAGDPGDELLESLYSLGIDHELGEKTRLFVFYTAGEAGATGDDVRHAALGIRHEF